MKICVIMGENFEEIEAVAQIDILRRAKIDVTVYGIGGKTLKGRTGITLIADEVFDSSFDTEKYSGIVIPGGPGVYKVAENAKVLDIVKKFDDSKKMIFAICAAPLVLFKAGILKNKKFTCYPGVEKEISDGIHCVKKVVVDENIITSMGAGTSVEGALAMVEYLLSAEAAKKLAKEIVFY